MWAKDDSKSIKLQMKPVYSAFSVLTPFLKTSNIPLLTFPGKWSKTVVCDIIKQDWQGKVQ